MFEIIVAIVFSAIVVSVILIATVHNSHNADIDAACRLFEDVAKKAWPDAAPSVQLRNQLEIIREEIYTLRRKGWDTQNLTETYEKLFVRAQELGYHELLEEHHERA